MTTLPDCMRSRHRRRIALRPPREAGRPRGSAEGRLKNDSRRKHPHEHGRAVEARSKSRPIEDTSLLAFYRDMNQPERRTFWACAVRLGARRHGLHDLSARDRHHHRDVEGRSRQRRTLPAP